MSETGSRRKKTQRRTLDLQVVVCTGLVVVVVVFSITLIFIYFLLCMSSLSICAILLTVFDFSTYVVNKHLIKRKNRPKLTLKLRLKVTGELSREKQHSLGLD